MKYNYSIDDNNQLLIKPPGKKGFLPVKGRLGIDKNNRLMYWLNEPDSWRRIYGIPKRIVFEGSWRLNKNYDLELVLDKSKNQFQGDILSAKGEIISTDSDRLAFEVKTYDHNGLLHIQILQLSVIWLADDKNRICFVIKKRSPDIFTLEGNWRINKNQQITYTYEKTRLKRKTKIARTITFEGLWQINDSNKLTYILRHSLDSRFDFRAQIESPNIYSQEGLIKYRLGSGIREAGRLRKKTVYIYGEWKFSRKLGLSFQVDYGNNGVSLIEFGADVALGKKDELSFVLKNKEGEPLGLNVIFKHKFLKTFDAEALLRLRVSSGRQEAEAGVRIPF